MITLFVYLAVNWWATWYPGAEPGGGGYVAQRIFSAKDERHGVLATLWFNVAHYALRPWPWILTALASIVLYPDLADKEVGLHQDVHGPDVFPAVAARLHDRRLRGRLHVDDRHAAQLGRVVRRQRFLPPLRRPRRPASGTTSSPRKSTTVLLMVVLARRHFLSRLDRATPGSC